MSKNWADSLRQLADRVGKSRPAVTDWINHPEWDQPRKPPWDVAKAAAWAKRVLSPDPAQTWRVEQTATGETGLDALRKHPLNAAKLKLTVVRAQLLELQKAILSGDYIPRKDIETALVRRAYTVRAAMQAIPRQLASQLAPISDER